MKKGILHSSLVLKLNAGWQAVGHMTVKDTFNRMFTDGEGALRPLDVVLNADGSISSDTFVHDRTSWRELPVRPEDIFIGLPHGRRMRVPLVVIAPTFMGLPRVKLQFNNRGLYTRDKGICSYCLKQLEYDEATNDHVIPTSRKELLAKMPHLNPNSWENCVLSCAPCNTKKGNKTPEEAGMQLRRVPKVPSARMGVTTPRDGAPPEHLALLRAA